MSQRAISTSSYGMVKAIEDLETNPYFEKYAGKIAKFQKESPEEFLARFDKGKEVKESQPGGHGFSKVAEKPKDTASQKPACAHTAEKKLTSVLKLELLEGKTNEELTFIWTDHFLHKDAVSGIIPAATYDKMYENAVKYATFLLPLPRDNGYEFIVVQFSGHEIHFTPLINYQAYKEDAPECLTLVHYPDLKEERGIVLMCGEYDKKIINSFEAQCLVNQVQLYYTGVDAGKTALMHTFHSDPESFKHSDLIKQLEHLDLSSLSQDKTKP
ncbi:hypothetical protein Pmani_031839 [Petrolisthes manimaculis]|uniref:ATP synthase mitochondrial F1 complex assembly factor 1 n=1 Tax=Petrolisthes manimaculis TaxID=1843537 RepID=A0AAE1TUD7_9EUCA|nr:hypothetical protein Pmani_031839 [Petrolisthes manimaculis]